jgi:hypothetical protein
MEANVVEVGLTTFQIIRDDSVLHSSGCVCTGIDIIILSLIVWV